MRPHWHLTSAGRAAVQQQAQGHGGTEASQPGAEESCCLRAWREEGSHAGAAAERPPQRQGGQAAHPASAAEEGQWWRAVKTNLLHSKASRSVVLMRIGGAWGAGGGAVHHTHCTCAQEHAKKVEETETWRQKYSKEERKKRAIAAGLAEKRKSKRQRTS